MNVNKNRKTSGLYNRKGQRLLNVFKVCFTCFSKMYNGNKNKVNILAHFSAHTLPLDQHIIF